VLTHQWTCIEDPEFHGEKQTVIFMQREKYEKKVNGWRLAGFSHFENGNLQEEAPQNLSWSIHNPI
jgi:hypothetical protein